MFKFTYKEFKAAMTTMFKDTKDNILIRNKKIKNSADKQKHKGSKLAIFRPNRSRRDLKEVARIHRRTIQKMS